MEPQDRTRPIRVALSNDYELVLLGLADMLARHPRQVQIVEITTSPEMTHYPDVILYDTFGRVPEDDVKLRQMVAANDALVIVYSWSDYPEETARAFGAAGYVHKGLTSSELVAAIVTLHDGDPLPAVSGGGDAVLTWPGKVAGLTQRESEVLSFIVRGLTNEQIARRSYLSINTVKTYVRTTYRKIGVRSRAQAVAWGYRNGFEPTDETGL